MIQSLFCYSGLSLWQHASKSWRKCQPIGPKVAKTTRSPAIAKVGPTVLVITDLKGHLKSMIFISSEKVYATSY